MQNFLNEICLFIYYYYPSYHSHSGLLRIITSFGHLPYFWSAFETLLDLPWDQCVLFDQQAKKTLKFIRISLIATDVSDSLSDCQ